MILAHHIILTGYGHWLPNDPRGSLSREFRAPELEALGEIHFGRKKEQPSPEVLKAFYRDAKPLLKYPTLWFEKKHFEAIGASFDEVIVRNRLTCYACAILHNHAHLVLRRHRMTAQEMIEVLRVFSRQVLLARELVPPNHPVWSLDPYVAYKDSVTAIESAIAYVRSNLTKHRLPPQAWSFVVPYDGWPFRGRPGAKGLQS